MLVSVLSMLKFKLEAEASENGTDPGDNMIQLIGPENGQDEWFDLCIKNIVLPEGLHYES